MSEQVNVTTLANGLRVVTEHMPHVKSAALGVWVAAGSRNETEAQSGLSHMLEHMAFDGTETRTSREIAEEVEDVGGDINAYTDYEVTAYQARVLAEHVPLATGILADILRHSTFPNEEIEKERDVILQEIGERNDMPSMVALETLQEVAFPDQPLGRPILGTPDSVCSFDRRIISGYLDTHYCPSRLILAAAGQVDHDALVRDAEQYFGDMERRTLPDIVPGRFASGAERILRETDQAHVALGFSAPDSRDIEAQLRAQTAANVLGGGMSSRLFQEAREQRGLCYSIYSYTEAFNDAGLMTVYAATGAEKAEELASLILDILARTAEDASDREIARARAQAKAGLLMSLESPMRRAEALARQVFLRGRPLSLDEITAMIEAVDARAVRGALTDMLDGPAPCAVYLGPEGGTLPERFRCDA